MDQSEALQRIAYLEFENDQLSAELRYLDKLLRSIGFPEGLTTVKEAALELMDTEEEEEDASAEG